MYKTIILYYIVFTQFDTIAKTETLSYVVAQSRHHTSNFYFTCMFYNLDNLDTLMAQTFALQYSIIYRAFYLWSSNMCYQVFSKTTCSWVLYATWGIIIEGTLYANVRWSCSVITKTRNEYGTHFLLVINYRYSWTCS